MKKLIILSILTSLFQMSMFAQSTATLNISGTVAPINTVTVTPTPAASALDLTTVVANLPIGTVVEKSNRHIGYTLTLTTANGAQLKGASVGNSETLAYTLGYDGAPVVFTAGTATLTNSNVRTPAAGLTKSLTISYDASATFLAEDTYADTLTLTLTAK